MITVYTTPSLIGQVSEVIGSQERMWELVSVEDLLTSKPETSGNSIIVSSEGIRFPLDWYNTAPPYLFPEYILFSDDILLGLIYFKLGNQEAAASLLKGEGPLLRELSVTENLKNQIFVNPDHLAVETYKDYDDYRLMHNHGVVRYYNGQDDADQIHYYFNMAMDDAPNDEYLAFTTKQYMNFLLDIQSYELAEKTGKNVLQKEISEEARIEITQLLTQISLTKIKVPYDGELLQSVKENIWFLVESYEKAERKVELALVLEDAAYIANISESFAESLGYISRAIKIYQEEELVDFQYNAILKRGQLLFSWAQKGQIQFYKPAIDSYQEALKFFNKSDYPAIFAEIQTNLGVIYSEIPDEIKKKSLWAAISHSAFMEALSVFTKEDYPYEYAFVCNSLGNALTKYPAAIHSDNFEKALYYYNESLEVRNALDFPVERSMTLLNFIEAAWNADNTGNENNRERYQDMWAKCEEIIGLNQGAAFTSAAEEHIKRLKKLAELMNT